MAQINTRIVLRNDSLANWEEHNYVVLLKGEVGVAFDTDGSTRAKIGDGVKTWAELDWYGGDVTEITNIAETKIQEMIGSPADDTAGTEATGIYKDIEELETVIGVQANPETGEEATGIYKELADIVNSTDAKINQAVSEKLNEITDNGKVDTVMELIQYVEEHGEETTAIVSDITELKALVGTIPVEEQIAALIGERNILGKNANDTLYQKVKYNISNTPVGTRVMYGDDEIRVMCPADTQWVKQNVGSTGNANMYYMAFKAYAPDGAVSFKEGDQGKIEDEMFTFDDDFAGTDEYGRNYSVVWLPLASYDEDTGAWRYFGKDSSASKYVGWTYVVEWYDVNGVVIESDSIRINISNEECHNNPLPYFMSNTIKEVAVNGVLCDVVNNRIDIDIEGTVKSGDEVVVNEDGTLSIVKLDVSKLVDGDTTLVLNGGGAAM